MNIVPSVDKKYSLNLVKFTDRQADKQTDKLERILSPIIRPGCKMKFWAKTYQKTLLLKSSEFGNNTASKFLMSDGDVAATIIRATNPGGVPPSP